MATLSDYVQDTRDLILDPNANFFSTSQIERWVNKARSKTSQIGMCVRYMPPTSASVSSYTVTAGGSGYADATVTISGPDAVDTVAGTAPFTATATAVISAGQVVGITVTNAGSGYVVPPTVTITSHTGTGAAATAVLTPHLTTQVGQELYPFTTLSSLGASDVPGLGSLWGVAGISISWGNQRPTLDYLDWGSFQAYLRATSIGMQSFPRVWSQYGQGDLGNFYVWPAPSQVSQMEADTFWDVQALSATQTVDLIPSGFDDAVPYYAASLALFNAQRFQDSQVFEQKFMQKLVEARTSSTPTRIPSMYL